MKSEQLKHVTMDNAALCAIMDEALRAGGVFEFVPTGGSMMPTLRGGVDTVVLRGVADAPVRRLDVALYKRADGRFVLHRAIRAPRGGALTFCGDGQVVPETGIAREQVIGVMCEFSRGGKRISVRSPLYRAYSFAWVALRPLRRVVRGVRRRLSKLRQR